MPPDPWYEDYARALLVERYFDREATEEDITERARHCANMRALERRMNSPIRRLVRFARRGWARMRAAKKEKSLEGGAAP